jgi:hypothetical protein
MRWETIVELVAAGFALVTSGWVANTLSTLRISKRISRTSSLALWIHGIHGIAEALDPIVDEKKDKEAQP